MNVAIFPFYSLKDQCCDQYLDIETRSSAVMTLHQNAKQMSLFEA